MKLTDRPFYKQPWYNSYRSMMDRCYRTNAANYPNYGGRGIVVCDEWHDIENFALWCEYSNYKAGATIERMDVDGDYTPNNCRWASRKEQANNRRNTVYITIDGVTKTISGWAEFSGLKRSTINNRYVDGVRGVALLHRADNTRFPKGYNRYRKSRHYEDYAPTIIEAEGAVNGTNNNV